MCQYLTEEGRPGSNDRADEATQDHLRARAHLILMQTVFPNAGDVTKEFSSCEYMRTFRREAERLARQVFLESSVGVYYSGALPVELMRRRHYEAMVAHLISSIKAFLLEFGYECLATLVAARRQGIVCRPQIRAPGAAHG